MALAVSGRVSLAYSREPPSVAEPRPSSYPSVIIGHFPFQLITYFPRAIVLNSEEPLSSATILSSSCPSSSPDDRDLHGGLEDDLKRARTQYDSHSSYPGMWTGRWTSTSPGIKEEKVVQGVVSAPPPSDMVAPTTITPALTQSPPNQTSSPATLATSVYPSFPESIVFSNPPPTTSTDILYDSINMSHAYPTLTSSLGECFPLFSDHFLRCCLLIATTLKTKRCGKKNEKIKGTI